MAAYIGSEANASEVTEAILVQQFANIKRDLESVAEITYDTDLYQQRLQKLLTRWETDGARELVDHLIHHGVTKDDGARGAS